MGSLRILFIFVYIGGTHGITFAHIRRKGFMTAISTKLISSALRKQNIVLTESRKTRAGPFERIGLSHVIVLSNNVSVSKL